MIVDVPRFTLLCIQWQMLGLINYFYKLKGKNKGRVLGCKTL
jgi:hypothetical protein